MINSIKEFFREKKDQFVTKKVIREDYRESGVDASGTWWPSEWVEVEVEEIDWEAFEQALQELEDSFKEGGSNAHLNPQASRKTNGKVE